MIERLVNGNMRVTSGSWDGEKVILPDHVLELRNVDGRLHIARKPRHHDARKPRHHDASVNDDSFASD